MGRATERERIATFVRDTLGCTCPDEVFLHIRDDRDAWAGPVHLNRRIDVGRRLLVYVVRSDDPDWVEAHLRAVFDHGRQERERLGFNRLRVVIATAHPAPVGTAARELFTGLDDRDERMHLHVVGGEAADL